MKSWLGGVLLFVLAGIPAAQAQTISLICPAFDQSDCQVTVVLPGSYGQYLRLPIKDGVARIPQRGAHGRDSTYVASLPEESGLPSFFVNSESIQLAKTPTPAAMANAIVKQFKYHNIPLEAVSIESLQNANELSISKLYFKISSTGRYMVHYVVFVNDRALTIGTAHQVAAVASHLDGAIRGLQKTCR